MRKRRVIGLFFVMLLLFFGIDGRIYYLSTSSGSVQAAATHGRYTLTISQQRGAIYDRNLNLIVNNSVKYVAAVVPMENSAQQMATLLPHVQDQDGLKTRFEQRQPFTVVVDSPDISVQGVRVYTTAERYGKNALASHITGYVDSTGNGVTGVERAFNDLLKSYSSTLTETVAVDAKRRVLAGVTASAVSSGNSTGGVVLTLDAAVQMSAQAAADKYLKAGAVVVMDVHSGDILASVSEPGYSPLYLSSALKSPNSPLVNRAFSAYNLGSVFKTVVACAALESGINQTLSYTCKGVVNVAGRDFHCEKRTGHGKEDMSLGFANSCNTYFITLGLKTGANKILDMAQRFGFGQKATFAQGLSTDSGALPTAAQLKIPASLANFSIGQGQLMATPTQVACAVSALANGGLLPTERLVKGVYNGTKMVTEYPGAVPTRVVSQQIADTVKGFMIKTVNEGTGMPAKPKYGGAGGKTSTAETGWVQNGKAINQAWFAGFYPAATPKYAIVVVCENGRAGGADAGPVFKQIADDLASSCGFTPAVNAPVVSTPAVSTPAVSAPAVSTPAVSSSRKTLH